MSSGKKLMFMKSCHFSIALLNLLNMFSIALASISNLFIASRKSLFLRLFFFPFYVVVGNDNISNRKLRSQIVTIKN